MLDRVARDIMLQIVDGQWKDHLYSLDHLKEGIGLRGYGQRDPLVEYKKESFQLFQAMKERVDEEIVRYLWWLRPMLEGRRAASIPVPRRPAPRRAPLDPERPVGRVAVAVGAGGARAQAPQPRSVRRRRARSSRPGSAATTPLPKTVRRDEPKVGRNDPCPCGSGKKYKKCHGAAA